MALGADNRIGSYRPERSTQPVPPSRQGRYRSRIPEKQVVMVPSFKSRGPKLSEDGQNIVAGIVAGNLGETSPLGANDKHRKLVVAAATAVAVVVEALGGSEAEIVDVVAPLVESLGQIATQGEMNGE